MTARAPGRVGRDLLRAGPDRAVRGAARRRQPPGHAPAQAEQPSRRRRDDERVGAPGPHSDLRPTARSRPARSAHATTSWWRRPTAPTGSVPRRDRSPATSARSHTERPTTGATGHRADRLRAALRWCGRSSSRGSYRRALPAPGTRPWWAPPESPDRHAATALGSLCALAVVFSYIGTLLSQTITFAADEFDASKTQQGATLAAVRIGMLGALVLTALADRKRPPASPARLRGARRGRRRCSAARARPRRARRRRRPVVRGLATAGGVLVVVVAAEEMPSGLAAFAITLIARRRRVRGGLCLMALPLADLGERVVARRHGGLAARCCLVGDRVRRPAPAREPSLRGRARRGAAWPVTGAASGCSRPPRFLLRCSRAPASQLHERVPARRGGLLGAADHRVQPSSPTRPAGSGW